MPKKLIENFVNIVTKKYCCFNGRAGRAEFWQFVLVNTVVGMILGILPKIGGILEIVWCLATLLPALGVTARRLHDRNKSGWLILVAIIPVIGALLLLFFCLPEGDKAENTFGPANS